MIAAIIIVIMAIGVALILTGKLPTAFALILISIAIAIAAGAPLTGDKNSILSAVISDGAIKLAATMIAILIGSWLGTLMQDTAIATTLVRKAIEFAGDRPAVVGIGVLIVAALCGAITGSAPAALLAGVIGIPAMVAVGIPKVTAAGTIVMGISIGLPFELPSWQFFSSALNLTIPQVQSFVIYLFPFALIAGVAFVLIETHRRGQVYQWAMTDLTKKKEKLPSRRERLGDAHWFALLTPLVPIILALGFQVPIIPSLLAGVLYAVITTTRPSQWAQHLLRSLYKSFNVAAGPMVLFIAIGMLLQAVALPGAVTALTPVVKAIAPTNVWVYVIVFAVLAPLCLYRGPLNIYGLGAGIAGALTAVGFYSPMAVLGLMYSYNMMFGVSDPTSTQTVWAAQYSGVSPQKVMNRTLPYTWLVVIAGLIVSAVLYL